MGSWGSRDQRKAVSGAALFGRGVGGDSVDAGGGALQLRGGEVATGTFGELRGR